MSTLDDHWDADHWGDQEDRIREYEERRAEAMGDPPENPEYESWCEWVDEVAEIRALEGADS